jgi:hypothetical protein
VADERKIGLYRRAVGAAFDGLPPALRWFHEQDSGGRAEGSLRVLRGRGVVRRLLANALRLPPAGEHVPVALRVDVVGEGERWTRQFGRLKLITAQRIRRGLLVESAGSFTFGFSATAQDGVLRIESERFWAMGIRLPVGLAPSVQARASGHETGWRVHVRIDVPLLGMLCEYEGEVVPLC